MYDFVRRCIESVLCTDRVWILITLVRSGPDTQNVCIKGTLKRRPIFCNPNPTSPTGYTERIYFMDNKRSTMDCSTVDPEKSHWTWPAWSSMGSTLRRFVLANSRPIYGAGIKRKRGGKNGAWVDR